MSKMRANCPNTLIFYIPIEKYNISIDEIKKNNNLKNNQLSIGQKLKI